jgi:hypothetical protein
MRTAERKEDAMNTSETATAQGVPVKRRVRNYLLDARLQLRFASYLVAVATIIAVGMGVMLWRAYREATLVMGLNPDSDAAIIAALAREDQSRMVWLSMALVAVVACLLLFAIVVTHKVAGPALVLARTCKQVGEGNLTQPRPLRDGDLLVELADEVTTMVDALRAREESERAALAVAVGTLRQITGPSGGSGEMRGTIDALERLATEKGRRLQL